LKKSVGSVRFRFYKQKTKKPNQTETGKKPEKKLSQNRKKLSQTGKSRAKLEKLSQTGLNKFLP